MAESLTYISGEIKKLQPGTYVLQVAEPLDREQVEQIQRQFAEHVRPDVKLLVVAGELSRDPLRSALEAQIKSLEALQRRSPSMARTDQIQMLQRILDKDEEENRG